MEVLDKINETLQKIDDKLGKLIESSESSEIEPDNKSQDLETLDVMALLSLPDHLRKTAMILNRLSEATASQVSRESGRARAIESGYLNQLVIMNYIRKKRRGRNVYFYIE